jgi:predicted HicB family RNase H-like nuclease
MAKGTIVIRMPAELHEELLRRAEEQGVSMNQLAVAMLAFALGAGFKINEENSP